MKIFVWPLCDEYYLGKIWNIDLQNFLNVMKIAQLIDKCNFHEFCRPLYNSKNYEICFGTLAVAVGLTVGELASVSAVVVAVKAEG